MNAAEYEKQIEALQRELRIVKQKLLRCETNREILEESLDTQSRALKVRNYELEASRELIKLSEARYRELAHHDNLTKLPNRAYFEECLSHVIEDAKRNGTYFALFFIDLDRFKNINDSYGHVTGDDVLTQTAERIVSCVEYKDTVARIGGDEFAVLITKLQDYQIVNQIGKSILEEMSRPFMLEQKAYQLGISIGISLYPFDDTDSGMLLQKADIAMYSVKRSGTSNYLLYKDICPDSIH